MKQPPPIPLSAGHGGRSLRRADCCLIKLERLAPNALTPARGDVDGEPQCVRQRYHVLDANSVWDGTAVIAPKVVRLSEPTRWPRRQDWGANLRRFLWSNVQRGPISRRPNRRHIK